MASTLRVLTDLAQFDDIAESLRALTGRCGDPSPYLTPEFLRPWLRALEGAHALTCIAAFDGGELVGFAPLVTRRPSFAGISCRVLGFPVRGTTPAMNFVIADDRPEVLDDMLDFMAASLAWDVLWLHSLASESAALANLRGLAGARRLQYRAIEAQRTYLLPVAGGFADFFAGLPKKMRNNLRRNLRNCREWGEPGFLCYPGSGLDLHAALDLAFEVIERSWKQPAADMIAYRAFFDDLAVSLDRQRALSLRILTVAGRPAAYLFEILHRNGVYPFHNAYDPVYQRVSPGQLMLNASIEGAFEAGFDRVDFFGHMEYISRWTCHTRSFSEVTIANGSWLAQGKAALFRRLRQRRHARARAQAIGRRERHKHDAGDA